MRHAANLVLSILLLAPLPACERPPEDPPATAEADSAAEAPVSEDMGLATDELTGLEEANVVFALPWVAGPVNREPTAGAAPVALEDVSGLSHELFDRVVFSFAEGALPGYQLEWVGSAPVRCGTEEAAALDGAQFLRVRLRSVAGRDPDPPAAEQGSNLEGVALTCAGDGELEWHLGLRERGQIRVVEMRAPPRLVVDVRRPETGGP